MSKYNRPSLGKATPAAVKTTGTKPAGSVFKSNPVYKGDNSPKTNPTAFGGKQ